MVIAAAVNPTAPFTEIKATFTGAANSTYNLDFFDNGTTTDPSGYGQGRIYLGSTTITTDANGDPSPGSTDFIASVNAALPVGDILTITITDPTGNTSQFSNDVTVIAAPTIQASGLGVAVRGQRLSYTIATSGSDAADLAAGFNYQAAYSDGTAPESFSSTATSLTTPVPHFFFVNQATPYTVFATIMVTDQYGFSASSTVNTTMYDYALENNNTELDVGAAFGGSSFVLTGQLNALTHNFNLNVDNGNLLFAYDGANLTVNGVPTSLSTLTNIQLWGNAATGPLNSNSFVTSHFFGFVQTHNGPGNNLVNSTSLDYSADAGGDSVTFIASPTTTNSLSFAGSDTAITFNLGELDGTTQTLTNSDDTLTIYGSVLSGIPTGTGAISDLTASNNNDTMMIPSGYTSTYIDGSTLDVTGGAGSDTFMIDNPTVSGGTASYTVENTDFTGGSGTDTINLSDPAPTSDTFTINHSSISGNDTFTIGNAGVSNDTFTIGAGTSIAGNDTFTISNPTGTGNDTFTINNSGSVAGNDTFTIGAAGVRNDTFTLNNSGTIAGSGNDTFTIKDAGAGNDTFTINGGVNAGAGNDTFTIGSAGTTTNDTFTINGGVNAGAGNDTFLIGAGAATGNDTFTINSGVNAGAGNDTFLIGAGASAGNDTFTINNGISTGAGNDTFVINNPSAGTAPATIRSRSTAALAAAPATIPSRFRIPAPPPATTPSP